MEPLTQEQINAVMQRDARRRCKCGTKIEIYSADLSWCPKCRIQCEHVPDGPTDLEAQAVAEIVRLRDELADVSARGLVAPHGGSVDGLRGEVDRLTHMLEIESMANASLRQQLADVEADRDFYKAYVGTEQYRSDFRTASDMRAALNRTRQQLADVTAQRDELENGQGRTQASDLMRHIVQRHGMATADPHTGVEMTAYELACAIDLVLIRVEQERDRLRAELLQQPPTLEWLRETFGEPNEETSTVAVFSQCVFWWYMDHNCTHEYGAELETRADVLAAVAETGAN